MEDTRAFKNKYAFKNAHKMLMDLVILLLAIYFRTITYKVDKKIQKD